MSAGRVAQIALFAAPVLVAVILYWPTLALPLVYDTVLHTQLADDLNWLTVWRPSERFGFYRPLVFAPLLLIRQIWGGYPAVLLHALNVTQHALNAFLLTTLIWRIWRDYRLSLISGLLFASYPFTYQATIVYGNNAYLTVTGFVLLGLHAYVGRSTARFAPTNVALGLTILLFILGVLVHETAVLLIPLCLLLSLLQSNMPSGATHHPPNPKSKIQNLLTGPSTIALISAALLYLLLYTFLPRGSGPLLDYGGNELWPKLLILMQSAGYPLARFAPWWPGVSAALLVTAAFGVTLIASGLLAWQREHWRRPLLFGWGWWLGGSLLIGVTLPTYYIADGARLLYFGGVGAVLVWAVILTALFEPSSPARRAWWWETAATLLLILMLVSSGRFIRTMIGHYTLASEPLETIEQTLTAVPASDRVVVVNFPQWVSPQQNSFPAGNEWAPLMGDHLFLSELFKANEGREFGVVSLTEPALLSQETAYNYGLVGARTVPAVPFAADSGRYHVFISRYGEEAIHTDYTGQIVPDMLPAGEPSSLATMGPYALLDATAEVCGSRVHTHLTLTPRATADPPPATVSLFVQLLARDGRLLAQADGPPLGLPPDRIETDEETQLRDQRGLVFTEGEAGQLLVGVYDYATGERFPAVDGGGRPLVDDALRIELERCER